MRGTFLIDKQMLVFYFIARNEEVVRSERVGQSCKPFFGHKRKIGVRQRTTVLLHHRKKKNVWIVIIVDEIDDIR
jgi:hypothetical protein